MVPISDYDMKCFEDNNTNRLVEALKLFEVIVDGEFFNGKCVLVFFNKYDLFQKKIKNVPITVAFPDFPVDKCDPYDEEDVVRFIASKFLQCFDGKNLELSAPLHIHRTSALNTSMIEKIFKGITLDLVELRLKEYGII